MLRTGYGTYFLRLLFSSMQNKSFISFNLLFALVSHSSLRVVLVLDHFSDVQSVPHIDDSLD